jgi:hypothetical protein
VQFSSYVAYLHKRGRFISIVFKHDACIITESTFVDPTSYILHSITWSYKMRTFRKWQGKDERNFLDKYLKILFEMLRNI